MEERRPGTAWVCWEIVGNWRHLGERQTLNIFNVSEMKNGRDADFSSVPAAW